MLKGKIFILLFAIIISEGRRINLGGTWNRGFRDLDKYNSTAYLAELCWKLGNVTKEKGLGYNPADFSYSIQATLLGVTLDGTVSLTEGLVLKSAPISNSGMDPIVNRTQDLSVGFLNISVTLPELSTLHTLRTQMKENNVEGSVETNLKNVDFRFEISHTFSTNVNVVTPLDFVYSEEDVSWIMKPRTTTIYAIETITKRQNETKEWYKDSLEKWQKDTLGPLILQQVEGLTFPLDPN